MRRVTVVVGLVLIFLLAFVLSGVYLFPVIKMKIDPSHEIIFAGSEEDFQFGLIDTNGENFADIEIWLPVHKNFRRVLAHYPSKEVTWSPDGQYLVLLVSEYPMP